MDKTIPIPSRVSIGIVEVKPQIIKLMIPSLSIRDIAHHFSNRDHFVFLDSRMTGSRSSGYSFIAFDPFMIFTSMDESVTLQIGAPGKRETFLYNTGEVFDILDALLHRYNISMNITDSFSPFVGGGIGYLGYEMGRLNETLPKTARHKIQIPHSYIAFYNGVIIFDHQTEKLFYSYFDPSPFSHPINPSNSIHLDNHFLEPKNIEKEINGIPPNLYDNMPISEGWKNRDNKNPLAHFDSDFDASYHKQAINRIKQYILAGDVYQVNMTGRFETSMNEIDSWELYRRLMDINPAPFGAYLNFDGVKILSSSPERFLKIKETYIETRPIKGTVKRGATPEEDEENRLFLVNDEKNRAELAMIVDLMRNDIGKVCKAGTVKVNGFPELETYPSLHHLVSTITGELLQGKNVIDVLKGAFPGGSITGAPKIRAMEIIDELEPVERGVYTGAIGYLGFNGCSDLNIAIRTITVSQNKAHIQAGGGIVADSVDSSEYDEMILKARKLFDAFLKN